MNVTTTICPHCKEPFTLSEAIQHQVEEELIKAKSKQTKLLEREYNTQAEKKIELAVQSALEKAEQNSELETEKLRIQATNAKESEKQLREELTTLLDELSKATQARDEAELSARRELFKKENLIREEATKKANEKANEDYNTKIREQEETIGKLREQLTTAKQVAEQGSQQLQGEILEIDIENNLRSAFPFDEITEVKKGERGADIRQIVNERTHQDCGLILWECKNAKTYQQSWLTKLKDTLSSEKAQIGVIVFSSPSDDSEDFKQLSENIWLVKPRYAIMLATFLREVCSKVALANRNAEGKDIKVEMIYNYLTGGEFNSRVRHIIESYNDMATQLTLEKKQTQKRWAAQEKIIEKVTTSLYGMSGDLQGIAGQEIIALPDINEE
ncbi:MAG: DUF2130 domain-containing protein [Oscillospiraceae bacterium]|nr:DUF2130 domain-containing protein [Oscillospiraceae bacterium]